MKSLIEKWKTIRLQMVDLYLSTPAHLRLKSPPGLANNLVWQLGHVVRSMDALTWNRAKIAATFPEELVPYFAKGTSPADWQKSEGLDDIVVLAEEKSRNFALQKIEEVDFLAPYPEAYLTSVGIQLLNLRDGFEYNAMHESIHLGQMGIYRKLLCLHNG